MHTNPRGDRTALTTSSPSRPANTSEAEQESSRSMPDRPRAWPRPSRPAPLADGASFTRGQARHRDGPPRRTTPYSNKAITLRDRPQDLCQTRVLTPPVRVGGVLVEWLVPRRVTSGPSSAAHPRGRRHLRPPGRRASRGPGRHGRRGVHPDPATRVPEPARRPHRPPHHRPAGPRGNTGLGRRRTPPHPRPPTPWNTSAPRSPPPRRKASGPGGTGESVEGELTVLAWKAPPPRPWPGAWIDRARVYWALKLATPRTCGSVPVCPVARPRRLRSPGPRSPGIATSRW